MNLRIVVKNDTTARVLDTGLGAMVRDDELILPFTSDENAVDCLRIIIRQIERGDDWEPLFAAIDVSARLSDGSDEEESRTRG